MQIVNTSTPANHFHLLRRQIKRDFRKPLVVFSPKMLLRYPDATSSLDEMSKGAFQEVLDDPTAVAKNIDTVVLCSGKFYYEMKVKAAELGVKNMAFVRVEQLYPLPTAQIDAIVAKYKAKNILWAQEEPANMGATRRHLQTSKCRKCRRIKKITRNSTQTIVQRSLCLRKESLK
jgi:2-oxoglutarate dehydrogenase E1 component